MIPVHFTFRLLRVAKVSPSPPRPRRSERGSVSKQQLLNIIPIGRRLTIRAIELVAFPQQVQRVQAVMQAWPSGSVSFTQINLSLPESAQHPLPDLFLMIEINRGKDLELFLQPHCSQALSPLSVATKGSVGGNLDCCPHQTCDPRRSVCWFQVSTSV